MAPAVPTGMNMGVLTDPCGVCIVPALAPEESKADSENEKFCGFIYLRMKINRCEGAQHRLEALCFDVQRLFVKSVSGSVYFEINLPDLTSEAYFLTPSIMSSPLLVNWTA